MCVILSLRDFTSEHLRAGVTAATFKYRHTIRPIYAKMDGKLLTHIGTCFFLEHNYSIYIITAAHVIDESNHAQLWISGFNELYPLVGEFLTTYSANCIRNNDHYDFALSKITHEYYEKLGKPGFIQSSDISPNRVNPAKRVYLAMGLPCSKNKINPTGRVIRPKLARYYSSWKEMRELYATLDLTGDDHIAIDRDRISRKYNGELDNSYNPRGMSGGPLIDLGKMSTPESLTRTEVYPGQLAGILIEHHSSHKAILSVKINVVLEYIARHS